MLLKKHGRQGRKNNEGIYLEVKLHTKLKHKILSYYFSGGWKNAFKSGNIYSLYYVDLFAGDGFCFCGEIDEDLEKYLPDDLIKRRWSPSFFDLIRYANDAKFQLKCIFNDIDKNNIDSLLKEIKKKGYSDFIDAYYCKDANVIYKEILDLIGKPNKPSLFYIDPTNHSHLHFSTIEAIANFKDEKSGRMPELIINFMLNSIFMSIKRGLNNKDLESINKFLDSKFSRQEIIDIIYDKTKRTDQIFLNIFYHPTKSSLGLVF